MDPIIRTAVDEHDLAGILALQARNLPDALTDDERERGGFLTLRHDVALLREMNSPWPHTVAVCDEEVVGYALVLSPELAPRFPELDGLRRHIARLDYKGQRLADLRYYLMGQVCVAREHRGSGLLERIYAHQREQLRGAFDCSITAIDLANTRSMRAHQKAGFEIVHTDDDPNDGWAVVVMDLRP